MAVPAATLEVGEERVARLQRLEEQRVPGADDVRHRQLGRDREAAPLLEDRALVAALGEQLDPLAVLAYDPDRAGARLGCPQPFGQDRVEDLLRRQRLGQAAGDA